MVQLGSGLPHRIWVRAVERHVPFGYANTGYRTFERRSLVTAVRWSGQFALSRSAGVVMDSDAPMLSGAASGRSVIL